MVFRVSDKCAGGYPITDAPCEYCGATMHDSCGGLEERRTVSSVQQRVIAMIEDYAMEMITAGDPAAQRFADRLIEAAKERF